MRKLDFGSANAVKAYNAIARGEFDLTIRDLALALQNGQQRLQDLATCADIADDNIIA